MSTTPFIQNFLVACRDFAERTGKKGRLTIQHRGEVSLVLDQTPSLRRVHTLRGVECWIPRATVANEIRRQRERRARARFGHERRTLGNPPCWTGEARPDAVGVPLSDISRTLRQDEIWELVNDLGLDIRSAVMIGSLPRPIHNPEPQKRRSELGEVVTVKTPFNEMSPEQRCQKRDHDKLMRILSTLRMDTERASACYDVVVLGAEVRTVAESRGLNAKSLAVTVSRVRAR